jgi:hypothetical protein
MGLLDDAIREHLELKRRRGADPDEVARAEQEALGPVRREPIQPRDEDFGDHIAPSYHGDESLLEPDERASVVERGNGADRTDDDGFVAANGERGSAGLSEAEYEEYYDEEYYDEEEEEWEEPFSEEPFPGRRDSGHGAPEPEVAPPSRNTSTGSRPASMPPEAAPPTQATPPESPPQSSRGETDEETVEYDVEDALGTRARPAPDSGELEAERPHQEGEDVLEETPEFLQDAPEHDRLWFEQRPPRDFDFDG